MAKTTTQYVCDNCGDVFPRWSGKCASCSEWNTLKQFRESSIGKGGSKAARKAEVLNTIKLEDAVKQLSAESRIKSEIQPLDEVLGGGLVEGSVALIAGEPGIGKSTLLMQLAAEVGTRHDVLYVSGEESNHQVGMRAQRLRPKNSTQPDKLQLAATTDTDDIVATILSRKYKVIVVDSIQTIASKAVDSNPGNTAQITQSAHMLIRAAKSSNTTVIIVGHVTKEGNIAGPKILEHLVDVVLNLEGDRYGGFKVLRAVKNRFGSTNEIGLFEMNDQGLQPILNPSAAMLEQRQVSDGSVVLATMEGSRPLLVEVQALVNRTNYGYPKRTASGLDINRLNLLIAVLNRRTKLDLSQDDIFVNIVGGIKIQEPAADLAVCMAIASASKGITLAKDSVVFGEVGLSGEVRHVPAIVKREAEAKKLGFAQVIGPKFDDSSSQYKSVTTLHEALVHSLKG